MRYYSASERDFHKDAKLNSDLSLAPCCMIKRRKCPTTFIFFTVINKTNEHQVASESGCCSGWCHSCRWFAQTHCSPPNLTRPLSRSVRFTSTCTASLLNIVHVDMFSTLTCFTCCCLHLSLGFIFSPLPLSWPQLAAFGKQERRWKRAIVGKCSFLSGMTQAAAVISTVIVGHHQRASITPARSWHRQQVTALPARLAPTWLWKPSDIQKGTDLHWMHHWINTADYQLTYTVLYHTE